MVAHASVIPVSKNRTRGYASRSVDTSSNPFTHSPEECSSQTGQVSSISSPYHITTRLALALTASGCCDVSISNVNAYALISSSVRSTRSSCDAYTMSVSRSPVAIPSPIPWQPWQGLCAVLRHFGRPGGISVPPDCPERLRRSPKAACALGVMATSSGERLPAIQWHGASVSRREFAYSLYAYVFFAIVIFCRMQFAPTR
jgi:hypothetical protein